MDSYFSNLLGVMPGIPLPVEILMSSIEFCLKSSTVFVTACEARAHYQSLRQLMLVCRHWHAALRDHPAFYTIILLGDPDPIVELLLSRAGALPLKIVDVRADPFIPLSKKMVTRVASYSQRWESMTLMPSAFDQFRLVGSFDGELPRLQALVAHGRCYKPQWLRDINRPNVPRLKSFRITDFVCDVGLPGLPCPPALNCGLFRGMNDLEIVGKLYPPPSFQTLTQLLIANPDLRSLVVRVPGVQSLDSEPTDHEPIIMEHLTKIVLRLGSCRTERLLERIQAGHCLRIEAEVNATTQWLVFDSAEVARVGDSPSTLRSLKSQLVRLFSYHRHNSIYHMESAGHRDMDQWVLSNIRPPPEGAVICIRERECHPLLIIGAILKSVPNITGAIVRRLDALDDPGDVLRMLCDIPKLHRLELDLVTDYCLWPLLTRRMEGILPHLTMDVLDVAIKVYRDGQAHQIEAALQAPGSTLIKAVRPSKLIFTARLSRDFAPPDGTVYGVYGLDVPLCGQDGRDSDAPDFEVDVIRKRMRVHAKHIAARMGCTEWDLQLIGEGEQLL